MTAAELGRLGEDAACAYLRRRGCSLLARNQRFGKNEVDIIFRAKDTLVFCEVKTRNRAPDAQSPFGSAASAVTPEKQKHLIAAARSYLRRFPCECAVRFDVIEVYAMLTAKKFFGKERERFSVRKINHIQNAFMQTV